MKKYFGKWIFRLTILLSGFLFPIKSEAQVSIVYGGNLSTVRNKITLENKESILGYHAGAQIQYYPVKSLKEWSIINEFIFTKKGYKQQFEKDYFSHFNYLSMPVLINYSPISFLSVQGGVELLELFSTNIKKGLKTYNTFDIGWALGFTAFDNRRIGIYSRATYGLLPMLDYVVIDEMGNFVGEKKDLYNVCYSLGIRIKLRNEKIKLYK